VLPILLPTLAASATGTAPHVFWYISRAAAFVAYVLIWMSMLAGLGITSKLGRFWPGMPGTMELHRYTSLLGIGFGLLHGLVLLGDAYMNYTIAQLLVPFMGGSYRPEWVGFGQTAIYLLAIVAFSFYVRNRIGTRTWRLIHALSFAIFLMVLVHGLQSGTDSNERWALGLYIVSAASIVFGSIYRVLSVRTGRPKQDLAASGLVAVAGRAQARPAPRPAMPAQARVPQASAVLHNRQGGYARELVPPLPERPLPRR
jgi:predicted ferric reductase